MLRFIISILLLIGPFVTNAQLFKDLEAGRSRFVRVSVDPTVSLKTYLQKATMTGYKITVDSEIKQNLFLVGGFGNINTLVSEDEYEYKNSGMYGLLGADLNLTKYCGASDRDIFFVGLHYGYAVFSQEASGISISNYWGDYSTNISKERLTSSWIEIAAGVKGELAKNIFIGWTGSANIRTHIGSGEMTPYNVPGYGKVDLDSRATFDINFFISYAFTMKPRKKKEEASSPRGGL